mmetsp:Transcript_102241/g.305225  ORF Transcript_102241/g.305225 Transcript_102241/m.305225 type:complete len:443 (-) Transcript_102241:54-1382(-)
MIRYSNGGFHHVCNLFHLGGSAFPFGIVVALPCALLACGLKVLMQQSVSRTWSSLQEILLDAAPWNGFSFLVGFLLVFRTSQSYTRFWDACQHTADMRAQWYDAAAALCAFCVHSQAAEEAVDTFKHTMVRLFSMLHALALGEMEDTDGSNIIAFNVELLDPDGIDADSLRHLQEADCKVALLLQWMLVLIVTNIKTGVLSIPPPILSRVFQQIGNGMVALHQAIKISTIPFPFPYAQACDFLLVMHWMTTPVIVQAWTSSPVWAFVFSFVMVFIYWTLNATATGLENPFGTDANDLDYSELQNEMNRQLLVLLKTAAYRPPQLGKHKTAFTRPKPRATAHAKAMNGPETLGRSLYEVWRDLHLRKDAPEAIDTLSSHNRTEDAFADGFTAEENTGEWAEVEEAVNEEESGHGDQFADIEVDQKHLSSVVEQVIHGQHAEDT